MLIGNVKCVSNNWFDVASKVNVSVTIPEYNILDWSVTNKEEFTRNVAHNVDDFNPIQLSWNFRMLKNLLCQKRFYVGSINYLKYSLLRHEILI